MIVLFHIFKNIINKKEGRHLLSIFWVLGVFLGAPGGYIFHMYKYPCIQSICESKIESEKVLIEEPVTEAPVVIENKEVKVDVSGAVKYPGVYTLQEGDLVKDAIKKAGGVLPVYASNFVSKYINMASYIKDQQKIYIPFQNELTCQEIQYNENYIKEYESITKEETVITEEEDEESSDCININNATLDKLTELNGVGESTATKIIEGRPYTKIEDILNVKGIGESTFEKFKDQICI